MSDKRFSGAWIAILFLLPVGVLLTLVGWVFDLFPDAVNEALSILTVAVCLLFAWRLQRAAAR